MAKRFTIKSNLHNGYAAMGGHKRRPHYPGLNAGGSVAQSIARERAAAARAAKIKKG